MLWRFVVLAGWGLPAIMSAQRRCETARFPVLPAALELLDSAMLSARLPAGPLPSTTFSMWFDSTGHVTHVLALDDSGLARTQAIADSAATRRSRMAADIAVATSPLDSARELTLRLTVRRDSGSGISLAVSHSHVCYPDLVSTTSAVPGLMSRQQMNEWRRAGSPEVWLTIGTDGRPRDVTLRRSSGSQMVDDWFLQDMRSRIYTPYMVDGFAKAGLMRIVQEPPRPR